MGLVPSSRWLLHLLVSETERGPRERESWQRAKTPKHAVWGVNRLSTCEFESEEDLRDVYKAGGRDI